ncbi:MAG: hypothetical protein ACYCS2_10080 [Acidimicrobiales bacterium]
MNDTISAAELKARLKKEKTVEVCGMAFRVRAVPLVLLGDDTDDFWSLARQGQAALSKRLSEIIANPRLPQLRRTLLHGVLSPRLCAEENAPDAVGVDAVLADYPLAVGLYVAVIRFTLESVPKASAKEEAPTGPTAGA